MKNIISVVSLFCVALLTSAQKNTSNTYTINGTLDGTANGDTIILAIARGQNLTPIDTETFRGGKFTFSGNIDGAQVAFLLAIKNGQPIVGSDIVLESGIQEVILHRDPTRHATVSGSPNYYAWRKISQRTQEIYAQQMQLSRALQNPNTDAQTRGKMALAIDSLGKTQTKEIATYIRENHTTKIADMLLEMYYNRLPETESASLLSLLSKQNPTPPGCQRILEAKAQTTRMMNSEVGKQFTDFSLPTPDGKKQKVSDIVKTNKLTLIDFWASWCGPCRAEMPHVKAAYEKYHAKGFEIVGVSLDNNKKSWTDAIRSLGMDWIHVSDLQGWRSSAAALYNVRSIPSCYLVDKNGKIVAKDLRGEQLANTIEQILK